MVGVVLFHGGYLHGGYLGVDLFFVLSGYLITSILLAETRDNGRVDLLAFWARRARRLLPALVLVLAGVALYATFVADSTELGSIRGDAFSTLAYVANWRFVVDGFDYWAQFRAPSPLSHTWSLAIEEQFYLVWPLIIVAVGWLTTRRRSRRSVMAPRVFLVAAGATVVLAAWSLFLWAHAHDEMRVYYGTDTRAPAILVGAAFAAWCAWRGPVRSRAGRWLLEIAGLGAVAVLAVTWAHAEGAWLYRGGFLACAVAAVAVLAAAAHPSRGPIAWVLERWPLVALGLISYGIYLWHWPLFVLLDEARTGLAGWRLLVLRVLATLAVAVASYVLVERPIRSAHPLPARARLLGPATAIVLVVGLIGATAGATATGIAQRDTGQVIRQAAHVSRPHKVRVLVVGNSVASSLASDGLAKLSTTPRIGVVDDGVYSCDYPPTPMVRDAHSDRATAPVNCAANWNLVVRAFRPNLAILVLGDVHEQRYLYGTQWLSACDPAFAPHYVHALDQAVATLGSRGARVILTTAAYTIMIGGEQYMRPIRALTRCGNALTRMYAAEHSLPLLDLQGLVCPTGDTCREQLFGASIRPDGMHYRGLGAEIVGAWMLRQLGIVASPTA